MRLIAFLRDSYREAVSGWMLQVMLLFAVVLIAFISSISFRPVTLEDQLLRSTNIINRLLRTSPEYPAMGSPTFTVQNLRATNFAEPWKSDYAFDFVVQTPTADDVPKFKDRGRAGQLPASRAGAERFLKQGFNYLDKLEVKNAPAGTVAPNELRFNVTSQGTSIQEVKEWPHEPTVLFFLDAPLFTTSLRSGVYFMLKWLVNGAGAWLVLAVSVVVTAGFVPNMLAKGTIDLLISKPVSKPFVLIAKYLGGLIFVFLLTSFTALGVWLTIGVRSGLWSPNFLLIVPILMLYFAVLYAVSTLAAVVTRNSLVAILATILAWAIFWAVGKVNDGVQNRYDAEAKQGEVKPLELPKPGEDGEMPDPDDILRRLDPDAPLWGVLPKITFPVVRVLHTVTPRTYQIDARLGRIIAEGVLTERELKQNGYGKETRETWPEMIGVSLAFIALCLSLACARMVTRDG